MEAQFEVINKILSEMNKDAATKIQEQMNNVKIQEEEADLNSTEEKQKEELRENFEEFLNGLKQEKEPRSYRN